MPIKKFLQGEVLTADEVNQYLMDQSMTVFASENVRDNAFGGDGEPVLSEGRFCYLQSTNSVQFYDGSDWQDASQFTVGDGTITTVKLADDAVTGAKIADNSITAAHIADGTIVAADIANGSVTTAKIADSAVTSAKIADDTIVNADINASAAIDKTKISGTAITAADTGTVTSTMIADGTIVNADVNASAAIELGKLADATIDIKTANYPLVLTDKNKFIKMESASNRTFTVPLQSTVNFPEGSQIHLIRYGSGTVEVVGETGAVILYRTPGSFLRATYSSATLLKCAATNTWMLMGDLSAT